MKPVLTRITALATAYAVALQVMLALMGAAAVSSAASAPDFCMNGYGASDQGGPHNSDLCLAGCAMAGCGLELGNISPESVWFARPQPTEKSLTVLLLPRPRDRLHALARAPPAV